MLTLFLHSPLTALCFVCHVVDVPVSLWDKALGHLNRFMAEASRVLIRSRSIGTTLSLSFFPPPSILLAILAV